MWACLQPVFMAEKNEEDWLSIADEFNHRTNFPNCIGAVDGKHIRRCKPDGSGSEFFNYKSYFSTVLMALVDADYKFIAIEQSHLYKRLERNELTIPKGGPLRLDENGEHVPLVTVGDEGFALSQHVLGPHPHRNLSTAKRISNYRLTTARRTVECAFGILCNKWRVFHRAFVLHPDFADIVVKACCVLHSYVQPRDGVRFEDTPHECPLENIESFGTRSTARGTGVREYFTKYFICSQGCLPWQYGKV
ncbi:hypothetical protein Cfor_00525 [Coptotermes formosanus]|uniref:DDE Tnp4 domain-containing protein n=1 Tax=Coptotermes formosanus TaxID=36987 RepID=A0A6L2PNV7_COPFO|nr:hypothetical protein Cfor_00525 [Coptotermes formosanus]